MYIGIYIDILLLKIVRTNLIWKHPELIKSNDKYQLHSLHCVDKEFQ